MTEKKVKKEIPLNRIRAGDLQVTINDYSLTLTLTLETWNF